MKYRGYLLHITHYDPVWVARKDQEEPFDLAVGKTLADAAADAGLNVLIIDAKDGVEYASHPELKRPYTQPMDVLRQLAAHAAGLGLEVIVKLNFSQSALHQHNHWFRPHNNLFDSDEYWQRAFQIIDELIAAAAVKRFFHIGMDEDHWRSLPQYARAIIRLHDGLAERKLRTMIWNDSACMWPAAEHHREKSLYAEERIPKDIIQVLWDYGAWNPGALPRIVNQGFELWGAPGRDPEMIRKMRDALEECGGSGMLLTRWTPCIAANRDELVKHILTAGPLLAE